MIIAQLSDLHIVPQGQRCQGRIDTPENLRRAVDRLRRLQPQPDVVLVTGDLAESGSMEEYALVREILGQLPCPYFIVPGNHDRRSNMLSAFADHDYLPGPESKHVLYAIEEFPVRLVGVDTSLAGEPYGRLCDTRLEWLEQTLSTRPDVPTLIFMHHPPFRTGIRWIDAAGLYGGRRLETIVQRHPQVQRILCGHVHRPVQVLFGGAIASIAPSSSHAQLALTLSEKEGYDLLYTLESPTAPLYVWDPAFGLVEHAAYLGAEVATYAPDYAPRVSAMFEQAYQDFCLTEYKCES